MVTQTLPGTPERLLVIGHRGAAGIAPENTLQGFSLAIDHGVDGIELDVRMAGDEVVVIHDAEVDRTTNGTGTVESLPLAALRQLDAGNGQPMPTLAEALAAIPPELMVNVELKAPGTAGPVARLVRDRCADVTETGLPAIMVSSFNHGELARFHALCPQAACAPLAWRWMPELHDVATAVDAWSVNLAVSVATEERLAEVASWGRRCLVYTVNDVSQARSLFALGATGVITDYPDRFAADHHIQYTP